MGGTRGIGAETAPIGPLETTVKGKVSRRRESSAMSAERRPPTALAVDKHPG